MSEDNKAAEFVASLNDSKKDTLLEIFFQLNQSPRFAKFVENNYHIQKGIDHEAKTIEIQVIEKPDSVGPALTPIQILKLKKAISDSGVINSVDLLHTILKILGQDENIILADQADLKLITDKSKLD